MSDPDLPPMPTEYLHSYNGECWWCGEPADSKEHKWKRTEVEAIFGKGHYGDQVIWGHDDRIDNIRGSKAAGLKFSPTLCAACNNARSQPFDHAYSRWSAYLLQNLEDLLGSRAVDFRAVFGADIAEDLPNLRRYYAKHIGCRLAEDAARVPRSVIDFLNAERNDVPSVFSQLGIRTFLASLTDQDGGPLLGLHLRESVADASSLTGRLASFKSAVGVGPVEFLYDINLDESRPDIGNGILSDRIQFLWDHDENLYDLKVTI